MGDESPKVPVVAEAHEVDTFRKLKHSKKEKKKLPFFERERGRQRERETRAHCARVFYYQKHGETERLTQEPASLDPPQKMFASTLDSMP